MNHMASCYRCGWEGHDEELVERAGNLHFYDHLIMQNTTAGIARKEFACPKCGEVLKSKRIFGDLVPIH